MIISSSTWQLALRNMWCLSLPIPFSSANMWSSVLTLERATLMWGNGRWGPSRLCHAWSAAALIRLRPWLGMHIPWSASTPLWASMSFRVQFVKRLHPNSALVMNGQTLPWTSWAFSSQMFLHTVASVSLLISYNSMLLHYSFDKSLTACPHPSQAFLLAMIIITISRFSTPPELYFSMSFDNSMIVLPSAIFLTLGLFNSPYINLSRQVCQCCHFNWIETDPHRFSHYRWSCIRSASGFLQNQLLVKSGISLLLISSSSAANMSSSASFVLERIII